MCTMKTRDENLKLYSKQKAERVFRSFFLLDVDCTSRAWFRHKGGDPFHNLRWVFSFPILRLHLMFWIGWLNQLNKINPQLLQNALSQPAPVVVAYKNTDGRHGMLEKSLQRWITKNKVSIKTWCHWDHCFALMLLWGLNTWHFDPSGSPKIFKGCYVTSCLTRMKQMKIVTKKYCFWSKTNCWEIVSI